MSGWSEKEINEIKDKAYFKWVEAGRPDGRDQEFWDVAEKEYAETYIIEVNLPPKQRRRWGGYQAPSFLDVGYFYAPYIPLTKTPVILDPESFNPHKGYLTRYGKKLLEEGSKYYRTTQ